MQRAAMSAIEGVMFLIHNALLLATKTEPIMKMPDTGCSGFLSGIYAQHFVDSPALKRVLTYYPLAVVIRDKHATLPGKAPCPVVAYITSKFINHHIALWVSFIWLFGTAT